MRSKPYKTLFNNCDHVWELHVDVEDCGGKCAGNGIFMCNRCMTFVTMLEKCALEQNKSINKSLKIQEKNTKIAMIANIIAATTLVVSFLILIFGEKVISYLT